jgi:hypothetical protein
MLSKTVSEKTPTQVLANTNISMPLSQLETSMRKDQDKGNSHAKNPK